MCGIIAMISKQKPVTEAIYNGLVHLQHRGQDAAGIFTYDPQTGQHKMHKNHGLVSQVFNAETLPQPEAPWGIGHVRYSTVGTGRIEDTHPLTLDREHVLVLAHNGNVVNYVSLKKDLEKKRIPFGTTCDAEAILLLMAEYLPHNGHFGFEELCSAVREIFRQVKGAYSIVGMITGMGMFAFRDPWGIRPLLFTTNDEKDTYAFASESGPLSFLGFEHFYDVKPGELIFIDQDFNFNRKRLAHKNPTLCSFEYNYFAKPNAVLEQKEVYRVRARLGEALAERIREADVPIDVVIPIPDSARPSAIALAHALKIPLEEGYVKQNYVGRTFIMPTQYARKKALSQKLITVRSVFENRSVLLIDDSVVRGTVSTRVIELAKQAGAKTVYFASTYPPIRYPCVYGIDFPSHEQLVASGRSIAEIAEALGAEGLFYNDVADLQKAIGNDKLCTACLNGNYPTGSQAIAELQSLRTRDLKQVELACKN